MSDCTNGKAISQQPLVSDVPNIALLIGVINGVTRRFKASDLPIPGGMITALNNLSAGLADKANVLHGHSTGDITGLNNILQGTSISIQQILATLAALNIASIDGLAQALTDKANTTHGHAIADVTGLQNELDSKLEGAHQHAIADTTGLADVLANKAGLNHEHAMATITGLAQALADKSNTGHAHIIDDIQGLQTALDNAGGGNNHTHTIANIDGLVQILQGKAAVNHSHAMSDISGLTTQLTHITDDITSLGQQINDLAIGDITGLQDALDDRSMVGHTHPNQSANVIFDDVNSTW